MDIQTIVQMRYIFGQMNIHEAWGAEKREAMMVLFDLEEEDMEALQEFFMWVANHGLEYAWEAYKGENYAQA
jgi:hypothetical protein